jgi:hypothetical protein
MVIGRALGILLAVRPATLVWVKAVEKANPEVRDQKQPADADASPTMAVSIAGLSTACSKDALVSSAKAVREALSTE